MDRPGGTPKPFCEAVITISKFHSSKRISSEATEHTPSTTTNVSGEAAFTISATLLMSDKTPVLSRNREAQWSYHVNCCQTYEVSTWVTVTILYFFWETACLISSFEGRLPRGARKWVILAPYVSKLHIYSLYQALFAYRVFMSQKHLPFGKVIAKVARVQDEYFVTRLN